MVIINNQLDDCITEADSGDCSISECLTPTVLSDESLSPGGIQILEKLS